MRATSAHIEKYNQFCRHYEIVSRHCYTTRINMAGALSEPYFPNIVAALIVFDMQRQMGSGPISKFDKSANGFAARLSDVLISKRRLLYDLESDSIQNIDLDKKDDVIHDIYDALAVDGNLASDGKAFHVGTTKILHFLHPGLFPIVDSNSAATLRVKFNISYRNSTQPGFSKEKYTDSMRKIQQYILDFGVVKFQSLEPGTPLTRIFDKLAFIHGAGI